MRTSEEGLVLRFGERLIRITNPDRVLWPAARFTKLDLTRYLDGVADVLLPHLRDRGLTLRRFPEGVEGPSWYQAQCRGRPPWMRVFEVRGRRGEILRYCVIDDAAGLAWAANLANLELHPFLATLDRPDEPLQLVVDLDPGPPAGLPEACRVALHARELLTRDGLTAVVKTSGALGVHVAVGLAPGATFDRTKAYARALAERLAHEHEDLVLVRSDRAARRGRVFVDWLQNDPTRSTVAPYSLRALPWPLVSMPLTWDEVEAGADCRAPLRFLPADVPPRLERYGELFSGALDRRGVLPG
jgi:bifunctional non-homologous end joining protein LigD